MNIHSMFHINMNCVDFERSLAFYQALGFVVEIPFPEAGNELVSRGLGVGDHRVKGALLRLGEDPHSTRLDLLEWISPRNSAPSPLKLTDPGLPRIALASSDFESDVQRLRELGVKFISDVIYRSTPEGEKPMFVCFYDPDGNVLELVNRPRA